VSGFALLTEFFELLQARHMPTRRTPSAIQRAQFGAVAYANSSEQTVSERVVVLV